MRAARYVCLAFDSRKGEWPGNLIPWRGHRHATEQRQLPATPGVRTVSVTRLFGVSVEKVVATMGMPRRLRTRSDMEIAAPLDLTKAAVRSHIGNAIFGKPERSRPRTGMRWRQSFAKRADNQLSRV